MKTVRPLLSALVLLTAVVAPTSRAWAAETSASGEVIDGYVKVGFDKLASFNFNPPAYDPATSGDTPPPSAADQIPDKIKAYDGKKAIVTGFMLPVKMDNGLVTEFLLVSNPMLCCYGAVPKMNEWVVVKMTKGVKPLMDVPVEFYGKLTVKEMYENGYMTGIYLLDGDKMGAVQG